MTLIRAEGKFSVINKFCNPLDKKQIYVIISSASQRCGYGRLAQLVEHSLDVRRVSGSSPLTSTKRALDEHLFFKRRFRRKGSDLMQNRKESQGLKPWLSFIYVLLCHHRLTVLPIFLLPFFKRFFAFFGFIILSYLRHKKPCE